MPELEVTSFVNLTIVTLIFSLLIISIGLKFNDIRILIAWADAKSFANSVATRVVTSADCFAYEDINYIYDPENDEFTVQKRVYPGVIDVRKFTLDRYFDCIEAYYHSLTSEVPLLRISSGEPYTRVLYFFEFKLVDLTDPYRLQGKDTLTTIQRLNNTEAAKRAEDFKNFIHRAGIIIDVACSVASLAASSLLTTTTFGILTVSITGSLKLGEALSVSSLETDLIDLLLTQGTTYTLTTPVIIRYVDEEGNLIEDHVGVLETKFYYYTPEGYGKLFSVTW